MPNAQTSQVETHDAVARALFASELSNESCADTTAFVVTPRGADKSLNAEALVDLKAAYNQHGKVLLRGFDVADTEEFENLLTDELGLDLAGAYVGGASPRRLVSKKAFSSTEAPKEYILSYHTEMSYLQERPRHVAFFCTQPAPKYSETPMFDCAKIFERLPVKMQQRLEAEGVSYNRRFHSTVQSNNVRKTWMESFGVETKEELEVIMKKADLEHNWLGGGILEVKVNMPAVLIDPTTGKKVLSLALFNKWALNHSLKRFGHRYAWWKKLIVDWYVVYAYCKKDAVFVTGYGNGDKFTREETGIIQNAAYDCATIFEWQKNDIVLIDNIRTGHGRLNVEQPRAIAAALGDIYDIRKPTADGLVAAPIAL